MFTRALVATLVLLIVTPFTAPFSTCDFTMLIARPTHHSTSPIRAPRRLETDASIATPVPPLSRGLGRVRAPFLARVHGLPPTTTLGARAMTAHTDRPPASSTALLTALRV
jgi:hypothetical protein